MNGSDGADQQRSICWNVLKALDEARFWLARIPADGPDEQDAERSGAFHLGSAGGLAFRGRLPGVESDALFEDISDAAEERDLGHVDRIRQAVAARLRSEEPLDRDTSSEDGLDWAVGFLQMLAALNEARRAWREGDRFRHSLMLGFLVGLLGSMSAAPYGGGRPADAVRAAHSRDPQRARTWLEAESIKPERRHGESADTDERALLLRWVADYLATGHRFTEPLWVSVKGETDDEREKREAYERAYFEREETSIRRAQNFGKRIAAKDTDGIWIPTSYSMNRYLVLRSHEKDGSVDDEHET